MLIRLTVDRGGRVLDAQAQKLISGTFANVKTRMAGA